MLVYLIINKLNEWRNKSNKIKIYEIQLKLIYFMRNLLGYFRGLLISLSGKIKYQGSHRPLIVGAGTKLIIRPGSSIILANDKEILKKIYSNNLIFLTASTIGTRPHYLALDPPAHYTTRIELLENAELILDRNTIILSGCYISGSHQTKIQIGQNSYISQEVVINSRHSIHIGRNVLIGYQTLIIDYDAHTISYKNRKQDNKKTRGIVIGDNVWIGARVTILKGVIIGSGSIIGANSCVVSDVPENAIAVGNPAKIVRNHILWKR